MYDTVDTFNTVGTVDTGVRLIVRGLIVCREKNLAHRKIKKWQYIFQFIHGMLNRNCATPNDLAHYHFR